MEKRLGTSKSSSYPPVSLTSKFSSTAELQQQRLQKVEMALTGPPVFRLGKDCCSDFTDDSAKVWRSYNKNLTKILNVQQ